MSFKEGCTLAAKVNIGVQLSNLFGVEALILPVAGNVESWWLSADSWSENYPQPKRPPHHSHVSPLGQPEYNWFLVRIQKSGFPALRLDEVEGPSWSQSLHGICPGLC